MCDGEGRKTLRNESSFRIVQPFLHTVSCKLSIRGNGEPNWACKGNKNSMFRNVVIFNFVQKKKSNDAVCCCLWWLLFLSPLTGYSDVVLVLLEPGTWGGVCMRISARLSPLKKGCFLTSAAPRFDPSRRAGSLFSKPDIKSRAWSSRQLAGVTVGNARGFFTMFRSVASFDGPAYGVRPYISS